MRWAGGIFGIKGRLGRARFFLQCALILSAFTLAGSLLARLPGVDMVWLLNPLALWALIAVCVRRLHDRALSGYWLWAALVPVLGAAWVLWQSCRKGVAGDNLWGPEPGRDSNDFLVVRT